MISEAQLNVKSTVNGIGCSYGQVMACKVHVSKKATKILRKLVDIPWRNDVNISKIFNRAILSQKKCYLVS